MILLPVGADFAVPRAEEQMETLPGIRRAVSEATDPLTIALELRTALLQPSMTLVVVYASVDCDLPALSAALQAEFGRVPVIGCTTAGEITPRGYRKRCVTAFSLAAPDFHAVPVLIRNASQFDLDTGRRVLHQAMQTLVRMAPHIRREEMFAFTLLDGLSRCEETVVSGLHLAMADLALVGGSAADDFNFHRTYLFYRGQAYQDSALFVLVGTRLPFQTFKTEHFIAGEEKLVVSEADPDRRIVHEINAEPAAAEYARLVGVDVAALTPAIFARHPLVLRVGGQNFVRSIQKVNPDGGLTLYCAIDNGIVLTVARAVDIRENLRETFAAIHRKVGQPALTLGFECLLRRLEIEQSDCRAEIEQMMLANNVVGFATFGEQYMAMHVNQTLTGIAIAERGPQ